MVTFSDINGNHGTVIDGGAINTNTLYLDSLYGNSVYLRDPSGRIATEFRISGADYSTDALDVWARGIRLNSTPGYIYLNAGTATLQLRDRFIVGAGSSYGVGATGGSAAVTLTANQMPSHSHKIADKTFAFATVGAGAFNQFTVLYDDANGITTSYTGGSSSHENRPPYYALCFIMKQ